VVFVASSDFTHFGRSFGFTPFPPDRSGARLRTLDFECIEAAATLDPAHFQATLDENRATVCGAAPIALLLETMRLIDAGMYQSTLDYQTSAELTEDFEHSVSYAALGYFPRSAFDLDAADRAALLKSATETLRHVRETREPRAFPAQHGSPALAARRGVFVSLHRGRELLGCVGRTEGRGPLSEEVANMTLSAALDDPRFRPAAGAEGPIELEISVLTPFRRIFKPEECTAGKHGLFLKLDGRSGLLLPQVATEQAWTTEEFLEAVGRKAMLGPRAWRDPKARLFAFEAQVLAGGADS
jgi:AmmeMemoRadiSam system protein A